MLAKGRRDWRRDASILAFDVNAGLRMLKEGRVQRSINSREIGVSGSRVRTGCEQCTVMVTRSCLAWANP